MDAAEPGRDVPAHALALAPAPAVLGAVVLGAVVLGAVALGTGCLRLGYVVQAAQGQLDILSRTVPLDDVVGDPQTPAGVRRLLAEVPDIKRFGRTRGLRSTRSYGSYADLDRPAAVWVVCACEALRFRSRVWSFPIVGAVPYLGYFDPRAAWEQARRLGAGGWDVDVREAGAFSTLGWFRDPIVSTMIHPGPAALGRLVNIVLHEATHATIYVKGQTPFNENVASFIGDQLAFAYLDQTRGPDAPETRAYHRAAAQLESLHRAYAAAHEALGALYASGLPREEKLARKARILDDLTWTTRASRPLSNATLMEARAYRSSQAELAALLKDCGGDWPKFLARLRAVTPASFARPNQEELGPVLRAR